MSETTSVISLTVTDGADRVIEVRNPGRRTEIVGTVPESTVDDVNAAIDAARIAAASWAATPAADRARMIVSIADAIDAEAETLATLVARENGSILPIVRRELASAAESFREIAADLVEVLNSRVFPAGSHGEYVQVERRPYGVVACIVPWNAPLVLTSHKLAPALAAGNTVVVKPSPLAPLGVTALARLIANLLPEGVVNVVNGGGEVGAALTGHPDIGKVSFTGGAATARQIMRTAAEDLTRIHFELGGNDPAIVLDDADLPRTVDRIVESAFRRSGQVCYAVKRIYVPASVADEFRRLLVERVDQIIVGDTLDPRAAMGPVNNAVQLAHVQGILARASAQQRDVRILGTKLSPDTWEDGHFLLPAVILDAAHGDEAVQEEQFGPVLPVVTYDTVEEAIRMANDTSYGLCSSVWSQSLDRAASVASRIEAGMTIVNNHRFSVIGAQQVPFGGWKQSGIGWEGSPHGIDEYLQFHSVDVQRMPLSAD